MAQEVLRYISVKPYIELSTLPDNAGKSLKFVLLEQVLALTKKIREIPLPPATVIVALLHKFQAVVPSAEDTILAGDRLVIVTRKSNVEELVDLFS